MIKSLSSNLPLLFHHYKNFKDCMLNFPLSSGISLNIAHHLWYSLPHPPFLYFNFNLIFVESTILFLEVFAEKFNTAQFWRLLLFYSPSSLLPTSIMPTLPIRVCSGGLGNLAEQFWGLGSNPAFTYCSYKYSHLYGIKRETRVVA